MIIISTEYIIRAGKVVTVSEKGTINDAVIVVNAEGKIKKISTWKEITKTKNSLDIIDFQNYVITPSLVDCHTHLLEYASSSLYPITPKTHLWAGNSILLHALKCGITALGEQICGHPNCNLSISDYKNSVENLPIDIRFSLSTISIGLNPLAHFSSITGPQILDLETIKKPSLIQKIAELTEYAGENIFINATPANFEEKQVPRAGEIIYALDELKKIVAIFHKQGKKVGAHVGGKEAIELALEAGVDVLHHAHGMTKPLIEKAKLQNAFIVATPLGGTHHIPNSPEEIAYIADSNVSLAIATDAYLPPSTKANWLTFKDRNLKGPEVLMELAQPSMNMLKKKGWNENRILALITLNGAKVLDIDNYCGSIEEGKDANFVIADGIPGLELIDPEKIYSVFYKGKQVIKRKI